VFLKSIFRLPSIIFTRAKAQNKSENQSCYSPFDFLVSLASFAILIFNYKE